MSRKAKVQPNHYPPPGPIGNTQGLIVHQTEANTAGGNIAPPIKPTAVEKSWWGTWGEAVHTGLDIVGAIPVVGIAGDAINAAIYTAEGDYVNAAISGVSAAANLIPGGGAAMKGGKLAVKGAEAVVKAEAKQAAKQTAKEIAEAVAKKKLAREAEEAAAKKATKEAEEAAAKKAKGKDGGKDKGKKKPHKDCGKYSKKYSNAPKKLGELNADHVPSGGALKKAAEQRMQDSGVWDSLSPKQRESVLNKVYNNAPTITVPEDVHMEGRTYGNKNKPLIGGDAKDLKGALKKDTDAIRKAMKNKDHGCLDEYNKAVEEMEKFDFDKYIEDAIKTHKAVKGLI